MSLIMAVILNDRPDALGIIAIQLELGLMFHIFNNENEHNFLLL